MFASGHASNYFRVDPISVIMEEPDHNSAPRDAIAEAKQLARDARKALTDRTLQKVENRQQVEPWLEKMGWPKYLKGLDRVRLMNLVKTPNVNGEPLELVVWDAMKDMLRHCQHTTSEDAGYYLRMKVVRSEAHQTSYRPLQAYMNPRGFQDYARAWKQIVTFFVRTQTHTDQEKNTIPKYQLGEQEQKCFDDMIQQALHPGTNEEPTISMQGSELDESLRPGHQRRLCSRPFESNPVGPVERIEAHVPALLPGVAEAPSTR